MSDEFDTLKAALKASPAPEPQAKAAALALAMENFDRFQGSSDLARLSQDRPQRAGFLNGVRNMLTSLTTRPALAATTSVAALCIGLFVTWPQWQPGVQMPKAPETAAPQTQPLAESRDEKAELGRSDMATPGKTVAPQAPVLPEVDAAPSGADRLDDLAREPSSADAETGPAQPTSQATPHSPR